MKLSCSTRCIPDYSFDLALKAIAGAGFRYLETSTYETGSALEPTIVHTVGIKETFARHRLSLSSLNLTPIEKGVGSPLCEAPAGPTGKGLPTPFSDLGLRREVVMARELWLDVINVSAGRADEAPRDAVLASLRQLADYCAGLGISLALANSPGSHVATANDIERALAEIDRPNVGVLLDLVRLHLAGEDVPAAVDRLASRTLVVRTGDVAGGRGVALGTGEIDNARLLGRLAEAGYVGFVVLELAITARGEVEPLMAQARERLDPLVAEPPLAPVIRPRAGG